MGSWAYHQHLPCGESSAEGTGGSIRTSCHGTLLEVVVQIRCRTRFAVQSLVRTHNRCRNACSRCRRNTQPIAVADQAREEESMKIAIAGKERAVAPRYAPQKPDRPAHPSRCRRHERGSGGLLSRSSMCAEVRAGKNSEGNSTGKVEMHSYSCICLKKKDSFL